MNSKTLDPKNGSSADKFGESKYLDGKLLSKMFQGGAAQLRFNADEVNNLNVFPVPDGDTGDNMSMTIESGVDAIDDITSGNLSEVMSVLSRGMLLGARGNSGVILSQFFSGMMKGFENCDKADVAVVGKALQLGVKQAYKSVITPTEGTILTVAREAVEYAVPRINENSTIRSLFSDLKKEMYASLQRTPEILPVLKDAGVIDSGGAGLFYIMEGITKVLSGEEVSDDIEAPRIKKAPAVDLAAFNADSEMTYGYCTELLLQLQNSKVDAENFDPAVITDFLCTIGDSVVSFKTETIVKIHIHTLTPEKVLEFCRRYGEFLTVKIENMSLQHNETITAESREHSSDAPEAVTADIHTTQSTKKYASVVVCTGEGVEAAFRELGADGIVSGGQTQNPSTQDFIDAFDTISAEHIFVFPNNGNIIMAVRQAASIYKKAQIHVIESKNLGMGYIGLAALDASVDSPEEIADQISEAMSGVTTGYISPAIRDAELNGVSVRNGDYIGFIGKELVASHAERSDAAHALLDRIFSDPEKYMMTVFCGADTTAEENAALEEYIAAAYPDIEVYFLDGGQEIYSYIFIAE